jgi:AraC family transcriptional regulator
MPEIKRFPKMRVAYVTMIGPYGESVQQGFNQLFAWLGANNLQPMGASFGIFHDDPAKVAPDKLRSELCVPVAPEVQGAGEIQVKEIDAFEAATIVYQGEANITRAYNEVYDWLRAQGYRDAGAPIEVYLSMPGEELRAEVYVPIEKLELLPAPKPTAKKAARKVAKRPAKKPVKQAAKKKATKRAK